MELPNILNLLGALAFGLVIGWVTSGILRRSKREALTDISTVIGALGGAAITGLFSQKTGAFGIYSIGLALGFWWYLRQALKPGAPDWLGDDPAAGTSRGRTDGDGGRGLPPID